MHTLKKGPKAAHPRAKLILKIAEFANFIRKTQIRDFVENLNRRINQIFRSIIHTQVIKVRAQLQNFLEI